MSKNIFKQKNLYYFLIPFVLISFFAVISIVFAWQEPTATPPGNNVSAPINVGNVTQTKSGGLNILGRVGIGTNSPSAKLNIIIDSPISGTVTLTNNYNTVVGYETKFKSELSPRDPINIENKIYYVERVINDVLITLSEPYKGDSKNGINIYKADNLFLAENIDGKGLVVNGNGNVGINLGKDIATTDLDINGQIKIRGGNPGLNKVLTSDANGLASWKSLSDILSTTNIAQLTVGKICLGSSSCIENWNDITNQTGTNYWTLSGNNLYPTSTSYSVGIGTSNPSKKLTVFANKACDGLKIIREGGGTGQNAVEKTGLSINMGNLHPWIDYVGGIAFIPIDNYNELGNWQTNPTYSLYLSSKGNVGIGTTKVFSNQDAKFDAQLQIVSSDLDSFADLFLGKKGVNEAFSLRAGGDGNISFHIRKVNFESGVLSNDYFTIISNGNVGIGVTNPTTAKLEVNGNIKANNVSVPSDINLKKDIQKLDNNMIGKVMQLNPITYRWKDDSEDENLKYGLIAQEVEKIFPDMVFGKEGEKTISYDSLIPVLIKSIQEQQQEIEQLKKEIQSLKNN